jgi:hypothetical protein
LGRQLETIQQSVAIYFVRWLFNGFASLAFHRVTPYREAPAHRVTSLDMKKILYLTGIVTLLSTGGCIFPGGGRGGQARYEHHDEIRAGPPAVVVRAPEVVVRPPEVIVR